MEAKFDNFAYYYHRFDLPTLNYSICTGGKNTSDSYGIKDAQGDMKKLHNYFLPKTFWHGHDTDVFQKLQTLVEKPIWQVKLLFFKHEIFICFDIHSLIRGVLIQCCSTGAKKFTNYVFCHPQFSGIIQNSKNHCPILTPVCLCRLLSK